MIANSVKVYLLSQMTLFKCFILTSFFILTQATCSEKIIEMDGVLTQNKAKLLKKHIHLSLYGIEAPEGRENSDSFIDSNLIVSPATINPKVESLRLHFCGLRDENIEQISKFTNLKSLDLRANVISDQGVKNITKLTKLEILDLSKNKLTDLAVKRIARLPHLRVLDLSLNECITDDGIDYLKNSKKLEKLVINLTAINYKKYKEIVKVWGIKEVKYLPTAEAFKHYD